VREFVELAFRYVGLDYRRYVKVDEAYYRPAEVDLLLGDTTKAKARLGWNPRVTFSELVYEMVKSDCEALGVGGMVAEPLGQPAAVPSLI
jgi:GDPmannose 4,6-dehydratase